MIHFGDITKISGFDAPPVDVIVGGSPCQDLSIAGKRAGLDGERSGLFMEQLRIIKEMRENDRKNGQPIDDIRPRYMVWENVPGAFSSHGGEDFRIVLEETAKVADKDASIPMPNNGKWSNAGCVMGEGWSIAWRILDAQFWGVPQRRRRIALVADFGGQSASEILFVRKSVSGHFEPSESQREKATSNASGGTGADDREGESAVTFNWQAAAGAGLCVSDEVVQPLGCTRQTAVAYTLKIRSGCEGGGKGALIQTEKSATLSTLQDQTLFQPVGVATYDARGNGDGKTVCTLTGDHENRITDYSSVVVCVDQGGGKSACNVTEGQAPTLTYTHGGEPAVCYGIGAYHSKAWESDNPNSGIYVADKSRTLDALNCGYHACNQGGIAVVEKKEEAITLTGESVVGTLLARDYKGVGRCDTFDRVICAVDARNGALQSNSAHSLNGNNVVRVRYIVRRLTPMECERLQGYPDGWTDIGEYTDTNGKKRKSSDAARYKALGNSIALPPWKWVMKRISACYERDATLASLFDGIGGFPYIWEQINGKGSCLWASEIEEFCIAVTKERIG